MIAKLNLMGQRFGRLVVISPASGKYTCWKCRCDCGLERIILTQLLVSGKTKSCGCLRKEVAIDNAPDFTRHGESKSGPNPSPEWQAWLSMKQRCRHHHRYKNRKITVCDRWLTYENFLADMGRKPSPKHSLDRINNSGNYEPGNCRWATASQQIKNRRLNKIPPQWKHRAGNTEWLT